MAYYSPNGGGYGSPLKRPAQKVLEDVLDGFYSSEHARAVYGVVVDVKDETVDMEATNRLRMRLQGGAGKRRSSPVSRPKTARRSRRP
jgi:N-methylhydantoinase B